MLPDDPITGTPVRTGTLGSERTGTSVRRPYRGVPGTDWPIGPVDRYGLADDRLTRDELDAEQGSKVRACLCASWELAALGRCVCPDVRDEGEAQIDMAPPSRKGAFTRMRAFRPRGKSGVPPREGW